MTRTDGGAPGAPSVRALLAAVVAALVGLLVVGGSPAVAVTPQVTRDVVLVGVPGLSWKDITPEDTPTIWALADEGAVANLNVRSTYFTSCPADGWLGLSAGDRAASPRGLTKGELRRDPRALPDCGPLPELPQGADAPLTAIEAGPGDRQEWRRMAADIADQGFEARIGTLGQRVADEGRCLRISGVGSVLAARTHDGGYAPFDTAEGADRCPVTLVGAKPITSPEAGDTRRAQVQAADAVVAEAVADLPDDTVVLVAGLSDDGGVPGLRALVASGADIEPGWLHSESTSRTGMAQVADLTYTLLLTTGMGTLDESAGRRLVVEPDDVALETRRQRLVDDDAQLVVGDRVLPDFFRTYGIGIVSLLVLAAIAWRALGDQGRARLAPAVGVVALAAMAMPAATFVVTGIPWWRSDAPGWALAGWVVVAIALALALTRLLVRAAQLLLPRTGRASGRRAGMALGFVGVIAGITAAVLAGDLVLADGRMTMLGVLGLHPLDGGRFHGFGNVPFALFATSALLVMTAVADPLVRAGRRRAAAAVVGVLGVITFAIDAAPWLGADGGGSLALVPAVGYLVLALAGVRITWRTVLAIAVATVVGFLAMAGLDWLRPESSRTHLGRFFQKILDGDALGIIWRKLETNVDILLGPERTALLVPVGLVAIVVVLARPGSRAAAPLRPLLATYPTLRVGLVAVVIALTAGFLLNDSGTAIPAVAALVLLPALLALAMLTWRPRRTVGPQGASSLRG